MNVRDRAQGRAMLGENNLERKKIIGMERVPKNIGMICKSLSGFVNG
jgi:hypothetical protein